MPPEYPAQHQHVRRYRVAIRAGDPCVGLQEVHASDARGCDASTCDADIVIVGFDEQCLDVRGSGVSLQHTDDVMPLPRACADDANRARGFFVDRVAQTALDRDQAL
jgi:hypothetical protein